MPIYPYECSNCGAKCEVIQKMSDAPLKTCEKCNSPTLVKKIGVSTPHFKGSGFYQTDYKRRGK